MIDHTGIKVPADKLVETVAFYEKALAPLGYKKSMEFFDGAVVGFADANGKVDWWVSVAKDVTEVNVSVHTAFLAEDRKTVDEFYKVAIAAGAKDNGPPGIRTLSHPNYYGAFVLDPAGYNIEAVCHKPE